RVLSSTLSRVNDGTPAPLPPVPEPPPRRRPPLPLPPPDPPYAQSGLKPISSGFCVSAGFNTQTPARAGDAGGLVEDDCAAMVPASATTIRIGIKSRNGRAMRRGMTTPLRTVAHQEREQRVTVPAPEKQTRVVIVGGGPVGM